MKELTHAQVQKARRRESKKNAIAKHKAFLKSNPMVYKMEQDKLIGQMIDMIVKTPYPTFDIKFSML